MPTIELTIQQLEKEIKQMYRIRETFDSKDITGVKYALLMKNIREAEEKVKALQRLLNAE